MADEALLAELIARIAGGAAAFDERGQKVIPPEPVRTGDRSLKLLYRRLPGRLPRLFEQLLLSYRWPEADLGDFLLFASPPGDDFSGFVAQLTKDPHLARALLPAGLVQFGRGPLDTYDPACFDVTRTRRGDCPIVQVDHEEILCNDRIRLVTELAPSFRALAVRATTAPKKVSAS